MLVNLGPAVSENAVEAVAESVTVGFALRAACRHVGQALTACN